MDGLINDNDKETDYVFEIEQETETEIKQAETVISEQPKSETQEQEIDLFAELSKPTDKDLQQQKNAESGVIESNEPKPIVQQELQNHQLTAQLTISAVSVAMGLILQFVSNDWTEEGEKRYSLSASRKKELLEPLEIMLANSKKQYNPVVVVVVTILITYVPMFITAFRHRGTNKNKDLKKLYGVETVQEVQEIQEFAEVQKPIEKPTKKENEVLDRVRAIKAKRGRRSLEDSEFMEKHGF